MPAATILVVDRDLIAARLLVETCRDAGYVAASVPSARAAMGCLEELLYDLVVIDLALDDGNAIALLTYVGRVAPHTAAIAVSDSRALEGRAMRAGAYDYLVKPLSKQILTARLARALDRQATVREMGRLRDALLRKTRGVV